MACVDWSASVDHQHRLQYSPVWVSKFLPGTQWSKPSLLTQGELIETVAVWRTLLKFVGLFSACNFTRIGPSSQITFPVWFVRGTTGTPGPVRARAITGMPVRCPVKSRDRPRTEFDRALWTCPVKSRTGPSRGRYLGCHQTYASIDYYSFRSVHSDQQMSPMYSNHVLHIIYVELGICRYVKVNFLDFHSSSRQSMSKSWILYSIFAMKYGGINK